MPRRRLLHYETHRQPLLKSAAFHRRMLLNFAASSLLIFSSLGLGMLGYHVTEEMSWIDSFANAAMILSGMGPLDRLTTHQGKLFAGFYALYSGLALIVAIGLLAAPVFHRILHRFHFESEG